MPKNRKNEEKNASILQYEGLYVSLIGNDNSDMKFYFRFYPKPHNIALFTISTGNPLDVAQWFHLYNNDIGIGTFSIRKDQIQIKIKMNSIIDCYIANFLNQELQIELVNRPELIKSQRKYSFVSIPDIDFYYVEKLKQKIQENLPLDDFDENSVYTEIYFLKYMDQIQSICEQYPTNTAKIVLNLLKKRIGKKRNNLRILL